MILLNKTKDKDSSSFFCMATFSTVCVQALYLSLSQTSVVML